jgi:hypothetical protein
MTSPRDGWAVGWLQESNQQGTAVPKATLLLHFQNCRWQPVDESIPNAGLFSVSMSSAADGWAVGATDAGKLLVLHYTGGAWQTVQLPGIGYDGIDTLGTRVRMNSSGEGWMLIDAGKTHTGPQTTGSVYTLLHFQGGAWTPVPLTFDSGGKFIFTDIAAGSADDCWLVGYNPNTGGDFAVAHYHNGIWSWWSGQQLGLGTTFPTIYAVTLTSSSDVWIGGSYPITNANGDGTAPLVLHFDGTRWTREKVSNYVWPDSNNHDIFAIAAQSPTEVWAFTNVPTLFGATITPTPQPNYPMAHYDNGVWTWTPLSDPLLVTVGSIYAVAFVSDTEGFAVADVLTQMGSTSVLLHFANGRWSGIPSS